MLPIYISSAIELDFVEIKLTWELQTIFFNNNSILTRVFAPNILHRKILHIFLNKNW